MQAGLPLATELTEMLARPFREADDADAIAWFDNLVQRISKVNQAGAVSIEEVFHYAQFDVEIWKMKQQLAHVGRLSGETPWSIAEGIGSILSHMEYELVEVILERQEQAKHLSRIDQFTSHLIDEDVIITFNYDTLVEDSVLRKGKLWNHGLEKSKDGITVLKMHGSIDWLICKRNETDQYTKLTLLFRKEDLNHIDSDAESGEPEYDYELARIKRECLANWIKGRDLQKGPWKGTGLAGLGSYKQLHALPGSAGVWTKAVKSLKQCDEVFIIGFSFSPFDAMVRLAFANMMDGRKKYPTVYVINPAIGSSYKRTIKGLFGNQIRWLKKRAEEVDWHEYLA